MNNYSRFLVIFTLLALSVYSLVFISSYFLYLPRPLFNSDLPAYLTGAAIVSGSDRYRLYDQSLQLEYQTRLLKPYQLIPTRLLPFRYPPFAALIYLPLTLLPFAWSYLANFLLSLSAIVLCLLLIRRHVRNVPFWYLLPLAFSPVIYSLLLGQSTLLVALSLFLCFHFLKRNLPFPAGFSLLLLLIKPQYFILCALLMAVSYPKRSFLYGIISGFLLCFLASLLLVGPRALFTYPQFILSTEAVSLGTPLSQLISLPYPVAAVVFVLLVVLVLITRPSPASTLVFLPFFLCLLSGHTLGQDLSLLLFSLFFLIRAHSRLVVFLLIFVSLGFFISPQIISLLILFCGFYLVLDRNLLSAK